MINPAAAIVVQVTQIDEDVSIGAGSQVWQFASIIRSARIGADCVIGAGAQIDGAVLGDRCHVGANAVLVPGVSIGNDVFIGPGAIFCNDAWPSADRRGFDLDLLLGGYVTIRVEDGAAIGAGSVILPGVVIGAGAMVAAGAVVSGNLPANWLWKRNDMVGNIDPTRINVRMRKAECSTS